MIAGCCACLIQKYLYHEKFPECFRLTIQPVPVVFNFRKHQQIRRRNLCDFQLWDYDIFHRYREGWRWFFWRLGLIDKVPHESPYPVFLWQLHMLRCDRSKYIIPRHKRCAAISTRGNQYRYSWMIIYSRIPGFYAERLRRRFLSQARGYAFYPSTPKISTK